MVFSFLARMERRTSARHYYRPKTKPPIYTCLQPRRSLVPHLDQRVTFALQEKKTSERPEPGHRIEHLIQSECNTP
jgi:hypothetical protein